MPRKIIILITAMLLLVSYCVPAFAYYNFAEGQPTELKPGRDMGYYIWQDKNGWHLFSTTVKGTVKNFSGVITTDGQILNVRSHHTEREQDRIRLDRRHDRVAFNFRTDKTSDGITFQIADKIMSSLSYMSTASA